MENNNKVALITGSGRRRIGNVVAQHLAQQGYSIALHYHSSAEAAGVTLEVWNAKPSSHSSTGSVRARAEAVLDRVIAFIKPYPGARPTASDRC